MPIIPAPKWATCDAASERDSASSSTCPPINAACSSRTVGPSHASTRSSSPRPQIIANGMPQTFAGGRRVGRVEVAVGIEPGDRERLAGHRHAQAGHRPGMGSAVAAEDQQPRACARRRRGLRRRASAPAAGTRRSGPCSWPAGRHRAGTPVRSAGRRRRGSARSQSGLGRQPLEQPEARADPAGASSIPGRWPPSAVGTPRTTIGSIGMKRASHPIVASSGRCASPTSPSSAIFARWEFAVEHLLCASDVRAGRWPTAGARRRRDAAHVARPPARLHRIDRPSAAPAEIAALYETSRPDEVLVFAGAEEAIFCLANVLLGRATTRS